MNRDMDRMIRSMVFSIAAPTIVDSRWMDLPEELKNDVKLERMKAQAKGTLSMDEALDIEAMAYLHTASLGAPLDHHHYRIYVWLFREYCSAKGVKMPFDASDVGELSDLEKAMLVDLKRWIRRQQHQAIK